MHDQLDRQKQFSCTVVSNVQNLDDMVVEKNEKSTPSTKCNTEYPLNNNTPKKHHSGQENRSVSIFQDEFSMADFSVCKNEKIKFLTPCKKISKLHKNNLTTLKNTKNGNTKSKTIDESVCFDTYNPSAIKCKKSLRNSKLKEIIGIGFT